MSQDNYPRPFVDAEAEGIPGYADDDSTARDDVETGRIADGPAPAQLPGETPLASDRYGTTAAEQRRGESLDYKLSQETVDPALAGVSETAARERDTEEGQRPAEAEEPGLAIGEASSTDPHLGSSVSVYDRPEWSETGGKVGRLIEPHGDMGVDDEKDAVGTDVGAAGGGATMEELAMHEVRETKER